MIAYSGSNLVRCAPCHSFATQQLADAAVKHFGRGYACLLASYGALACGPNIGRAFALAEQLEFCADVYLKAKAAGTAKILTSAQVGEVRSRFSNYGSRQ